MQKKATSVSSELDKWIASVVFALVAIGFAFAGINATIGLVNSFTQLAPREPFEAQGQFLGHGEGRVSDAIGLASVVTETGFNVGKESYESSGPWIGPLPPFETLVKVVSPTGYAKDVTITDLSTGQIYRSADKPFDVLQILILGSIALVGWAPILCLVIFLFRKEGEQDPEDDAEED